MIIKSLRIAHRLAYCGQNLLVPKAYSYPTCFRKYSTDECCDMSKKRALIFLPPGAEELEFVTAADVLRRGGIEVIVAGFPDKSAVKCSRDVVICPDIGICDAASCGPYDVMVLPGGLGGAKQMCESQEVGRLLKDQESEARMIAAICAAPTALKYHKIGCGKALTSYPAFEEVMSEDNIYCYRQNDVVVDRNLVTSRGPGTAIQFALTIVKNLVGLEKACEVANAMLVKFTPP